MSVRSSVNGAGGGGGGDTSSFRATINGDDVTKTFNINHGLGKASVSVDVWKAYGDESKINVEVEKVDNDNVQIVFNAAPPTGQDYNVLVIG